MQRHETRDELQARLKQLKSEFDKRLRNLRRARDITQNELAETLNVQGVAVGKYESQNNYPGVFVLIRFSEILDVS